MGTLGRFPRPHENRGPMIICVCCIQHVLMFKHWFCWKNQCNNYMFNFIDICIPVSGCVVMSTSALLCPGPIMLLRRPCNVLCHMLCVWYMSCHIICVWYMLCKHSMHVVLIMPYSMRLILVKVVVFISTLAIPRYFIYINY